MAPRPWVQVRKVFVMIFGFGELIWRALHHGFSHKHGTLNETNLTEIPSPVVPNTYREFQTLQKVVNNSLLITITKKNYRIFDGSIGSYQFGFCYQPAKFWCQESNRTGVIKNMAQFNLSSYFFYIYKRESEVLKHKKRRLF